MARLMTASYEKLIEEMYTSERAKLESTLESDAKEILNDKKTRNLLKEFIVRLDRHSNFEPNSLRMIILFELIAPILTMDDFYQNQDELMWYCTNESDLIKVNDETSLKAYLESQKFTIYKRVDESYEYRKFKEYLRMKYEKRRR
ncbi:CLUMA_CG014025, isoform A [Clunio marinus]|uniref:CLUMA_CG014025, isoform A n=1 Tax=Clunio marinus TaxID=568069 RepID=A0A1J1ILZ6_9DIPT|nr:CLUMA_CG014025, isoform A [Clunio marinus]